MAEQLFGLDINIDDKVWWNFSSHPLRNTPNAIVPQEPVTVSPVLGEVQAKTVQPNQNATQTIEEVVQGSESFESKVTKLFQGDFRVDPTTKPKHHLLINFEDKEGVPLILAMPTFTTQDIYNHFNPKPKPIVPQEEALKPVISEEVITAEQTPIDLTPNFKQTIVDVPISEPIIETKSEVVEPLKPELSLPVERKVLVEEPVVEDLSIKTPIPTPILTPQEVIPEPEAVVPQPEKIFKHVKFNGQLLGDNLLKKIVFDSFHYVKVNKTPEEPNFLWERFHQRQTFGRALSDLSAQNGANYMLKAYFTEGLIRSPYLLNRYFRNPVVLSNSE